MGWGWVIIKDVNQELKQVKKVFSNYSKDDLIRAFQSVEWFLFLKDPSFLAFFDTHSVSKSEFLGFLFTQKNQFEKKSHSAICKLIKELDVEDAVLRLLESKIEQEVYVVATSDTLMPPTLFIKMPTSKQSHETR